MRLALITEIPAPYRIPLFNALAERLELLAVFLARGDPRRPFYEAHDEEWRCARTFLPGRQLLRGGRWIVWNRGTIGALRRFRPDAVAVGGWNQPAFVQALAYAKTRRVPIVSWVESTARDVRSGAPPLELAKRALVRSYSGFFVPGRASREYLRALGVPEERIAVAPNAIDARVFAGAAVDRSGRTSFTALYVGRLDPEKGLDVLLHAFTGFPWQLTIAGSGSEETRLRAIADDRVRFVGAVGRDELVPLYAAADALVLPSRSEPWGMVLNEGAAAGLPLVATEGAGAAHDLIEPGVNGFRVPVDDADALGRALQRIAADEQFRLRAGARSLELSRRFTPKAWAEGVAGLARHLVA